MIDSPRRLVLVGSVLVDVLMRVELLPERGADVLARGAHAEVGFGRGVLSAARRHGMSAAFAGRYGSGPFGAQVRAALVQDGVDMLIPLPASGDSGFRVGFVEAGGARTSATSPGVETALDRQSLDRLAIRDDDAVYVSGYDLTYPKSGSAIAGWARALPDSAALVFDPGPLVDDIPWDVQQRVLRRCDILTINARATRQLAGTGRPRAAVAALREYAPRLRLAVLR
ncbi:MAG: PfkB family carbohydrate kinase, partial [Nocardioidaceae bacterium]